MIKKYFLLCILLYARFSNCEEKNQIFWIVFITNYLSVHNRVHGDGTLQRWNLHKRSVTRVVFPGSEHPQDYFEIASRIGQWSRQEPLIYRKKLQKQWKIGLIIKNHKYLAFRWICAKISLVRNTEAVAQWQSACLWNKMLWVRAPPASLYFFNLLFTRNFWLCVIRSMYGSI